MYKLVIVNLQSGDIEMLEFIPIYVIFVVNVLFILHFHFF